eukprot:567797_1
MQVGSNFLPLDLNYTALSKCNKSNITNGLFNYLNTTYPALDTKPFDVDSSPLKGSCKATQFIGLDHAVCYCITQAKECRSDNYFAVHLKNHYLMPSHYALRNYSNGDKNKRCNG